LSKASSLKQTPADEELAIVTVLDSPS